MRATLQNSQVRHSVMELHHVMLLRAPIWTRRRAFDICSGKVQDVPVELA